MRKYTFPRIVFAIILSTGLFSCKTKPTAEAPVVKRSRRILGIHARPHSNFQLIKDAGIGWVRLNFVFPFEDKMGGKLSPEFLGELEEAKKVREIGLRIMGITPLAGIMAYDSRDKKVAWRSGIPILGLPIGMPDWAGSIDSDTYYDTYEKGCEELGRQTKGIVDMWQVSNEMDIEDTRGPLSIEQAERFMIAGGRGVKKGNPDVKTDINMCTLGVGETMFRDIYSKPDNLFDYAGYDAYFGSLLPGGPQDWIPVIEKVHEITGKPVLINEWGYSSIEGSGKPLKHKIGDPVCDKQKWNNEWHKDKEHSPKEQAAYAEIGLKILATYPNVVGCFYYSWRDDVVCPWCGQKGCPSECGWGIVDSQEKPKPSYYVVKSMAQELF